MKAFYHGLNVLQVGDLIKAHPEQTRSLFVAGPDFLSSARFLSLILSTQPEQVINQGRAFDYFRLQVGDLIKAHPEQTRSLFVAGPDCLSSARFLSLILSTQPEQVINQGRTFDYFRKFVLH